MRCPVCRADNNDAETSCRRCRADLSLLAGIEAERKALLAQAQTELTAGRPDAALDLVQNAHDLRRAGDSARLFALTHLLAGNFPVAWQWYNEATKYG